MFCSPSPPKGFKRRHPEIRMGEKFNLDAFKVRFTKFIVSEAETLPSFEIHAPPKVTMQFSNQPMLTKNAYDKAKGCIKMNYIPENSTLKCIILGEIACKDVCISQNCAQIALTRKNVY